MKNRISKLIPFVLLVAGLVAVVWAVSTTPPHLAASASLTSTSAPEITTVAEREQTKKRVTFHHSPPAGPLVSALIEKYAGTEVIVQRQHFIHKGFLGRTFADALPREKAAFRADLGVEEEPDEDLHGWIFRRAKLAQKLLTLKPLFEDEWDNDNPQFSTLMLDLEPHFVDAGGSRLSVMNDALGLCHSILGPAVQVGFQGLPHQRGMNRKGYPPVRLHDSVLANQGAIFIHPRFTKRGPNWFAAGMRLTQALLDRVEPIRDGRPVIAFVWSRRSVPAGWGIIPDELLLQQLRLLIDANVEISVFGDIDAETAHVIELARSVILGGSE